MGKDPLRTGRLTTTEADHDDALCEALFTGRIRRLRSIFRGAGGEALTVSRRLITLLAVDNVRV